MIEFYRISSVPALTFRHDYMLVSFLPSFFFFLKKKEGGMQAWDDFEWIATASRPRNDDNRYIRAKYRHCEERSDEAIHKKYKIVLH